jgi:hypothetical protein
MSGLITRVDGFRHPILVVRIVGLAGWWQVVTGHATTFLSLVRLQ